VPACARPSRGQCATSDHPDQDLGYATRANPDDERLELVERNLSGFGELLKRRPLARGRQNRLRLARLAAARIRELVRERLITSESLNVADGERGLDELRARLAVASVARSACPS